MTPPSTIAHYRIVSKLGEGGMGIVYRATDTKLNRDVALKVLPAAFAEDTARMQRFEREAKVLASLNHPNIATIHGVEEHALVMELVPGPTLAECIAHGPMPLDDVLPIARQIAEAVEYAHERGIIHRDLKPANIKVTPEGRVKVLDFGLAKALSADAVAGDPTSSPTLSMRETIAGVILGTAAYMSPEQARGQMVDRRADVWSFGVVLYEMLTGERMFDGLTVSDTLAAVLAKEPDYERVTYSLRRVVKLCTAKDPRQRLRAIGDALLAVDKDEAAPVAQAGAVRNWWLPWALAAAMALAALAAIYFRQAPSVAATARFQIPLPAGGTFAPHLALSPDGRHLAFTAPTKGGQPFLWVRALDSLEAHVLPGTENAFYPFWSPDSRFIAFGSNSKLKKIAASGGPAQTLCNAESLFGGYWNRDGTILFSNTGSIWRVPEAGGDPVRVITPNGARGEIGHRYPQILPDGRHFLYLNLFHTRESNAIYLGSLDGKGPEKRIAGASHNFSYVPPAESGKSGHLLFAWEDTLMAQPLNPKNFDLAGEIFPVAERVTVTTFYASFTTAGTGALAYQSGANLGSQLTWFDRTGKSLGTLGTRANYSQVTLSRDGKHVAVERLNPQSATSDIWLLDLTNASPTRFTFDESHNWDPVWSAAGNRVAFSSDRNGPPNLYLKDSSNTRQEERIEKAAISERPCAWSPDGRFLMYTRGSAPVQLWILSDPAGDPANRKAGPYLETPFNTTQCQFSPDSHWVAYTSDESKRGYEVYVQSFPEGSSKFQVSSSGGVQPRWRPDGKELFYIAVDGKLMSSDVQTTPTFHAGIPRALFDPHIARSSGAPFAIRYDVTPDGHRFLINSTGLPEGGASEGITVVLNWAQSSSK